MTEERALGQEVTARAVAHELTGRLGRPSRGYWGLVAGLSLVALAGLAALVVMVGAGPEPRSRWGYAAAAVGFLLSTAQAAPILAFATRLAKGFWGVPLRRAAELWAVVGLITTPLFITILSRLPAWNGRPSIWFDWPGSPWLWDSIAMALLSLVGLLLLSCASLPDLAAARDAASGRWSETTAGRSINHPPVLTSVWQRLALGWRGTARQWGVLSSGLIVLGALYLMLYVFVTLLVTSDLAISLVPGWGSPVIPPYHAVSGLEGGVALVVLAMAALRRFGGYRRYLGLAPFHGSSKLLLALSLLFFYFTWSELLTLWYGRTPAGVQTLTLLMFGPYLGLFIISALFNFVLPFLLLIFNAVRASIGGSTLAASLVLLGLLADRLRIYVAAWSVAGSLEQVPSTVYPGLAELLVVVGALAAAVLLFLLGIRLVPPISLWECQMDRLYRVELPYARTEVAVLAKPS